MWDSKSGSETTRIDARNLEINPCKACNACMASGACVQKDDFPELLAAIGGSDAVVVSAPIYMNLPCAQATAMHNRLFVVFGPNRIAGRRQVPPLLFKSNARHIDAPRQLIMHFD